MTINDSEVRPASNLSSACPYCFTPVDGETVTCRACGAAHHADCYAESGACAVHGCTDSAERRDAAQPAIGASGPSLFPPPSGAAPVATYPPPLNARVTPVAPPIRSTPAPNTSMHPPVAHANARQPDTGASGNRRVVVTGTASATIYRGKLIVATSEGYQYEFSI